MNRFLPKRFALVATAAANVFMLGGCATGPSRDVPVFFPRNAPVARAVFLKSFASLEELVPPKPSLANFFGVVDRSPRVSIPAGIDYMGGRLFVCDSDERAVYEWDLNSLAWGSFVHAEQPYTRPIDVAVDGRGVVYVADGDGGAVFSFDADRSSEWSRSDEAFRPASVACSKDRVFVADVASHQVLTHSAAGNWGECIGGSANGRDGLYFPTGVATDSQGRVFVCDMMNGRIRVFDGQLKAEMTIGRRGDRYGEMGKPKRVAIGPDGVVFVTDPEFGYVHLFNDRGEFLMLLGGPSDNPGGTPLPTDVAIATELPEALSRLVPARFDAKYFVFVSNALPTGHINLYAIGQSR